MKQTFVVLIFKTTHHQSHYNKILIHLHKILVSYVQKSLILHDTCIKHVLISNLFNGFSSLTLADLYCMQICFSNFGMSHT